MSSPEPEYSGPSEERLGAYLEELREDPPRSDSSLVSKIAHRARWQQAIRAPLQVAGNLVASLVDGVAGLLGARRGPRP